MKNKDLFFQVRGRIEQRLRNNVFRVKCDNGKIIIADIASRFRTVQGRRRVKLGEGRRVVVEVPLRDLEKGQIVSLVEERD